MIDNEMSCSPNPQWLKDFKQEIQKEFNLSSLDATCIAGKVARIVRKQNREVWQWMVDWVFENAPHEVFDELMSSREDYIKAMEEQ